MLYIKLYAIKIFIYTITVNMNRYNKIKQTLLLFSLTVVMSSKNMLHKEL